MKRTLIGCQFKGPFLKRLFHGDGKLVAHLAGCLAGTIKLHFCPCRKTIIRIGFAHLIAPYHCLLEIHPVSALEIEHFTCLLRGCNLVAKRFQDGADFCHLFSVGFGQLAAFDKQ